MKGTSINTFDLNGTSFPLIWGGDAVNYTAGSSPDLASFCGSLDMNLEMAVGKIVVCESLLGVYAIRRVKGMGIILIGEDAVNPEYAMNYQLPLTLITPEDGKKVMEYIRSTKYGKKKFKLSSIASSCTLSFHSQHFQISHCNHFYGRDLERCHGTKSGLIFFKRA